MHLLHRGLVPSVHWFCLSYQEIITCFPFGSDPELIYLTDGASKGVMQILNTIIRNNKDGVKIYLNFGISFCKAHKLQFREVSHAYYP